MRSHKEFVMVELRNGLPVRIFLSEKAAYRSGLDVGEMRRGAAVGLIRKQVVAKAAGRCMRCKEPITEVSGHLHETKPRGMTNFERGEISVDNSEFICADCHVWGKAAAHANRRPQWSRKS